MATEVTKTAQAVAPAAAAAAESVGKAIETAADTAASAVWTKIKSLWYGWAALGAVVATVVIKKL
jgi:hypothetical protein